MKDENIIKASKLLKVHPDILTAVMKHAKEIDTQFKMMDISPKDNVYAVKIILQDNDENWYISQDEPNDDKLWADALSDDRDDDWDDFDDDDSDDDDGDGGVEVEKPEPVLT